MTPSSPVDRLGQPFARFTVRVGRPGHLVEVVAVAGRPVPRGNLDRHGAHLLTAFVAGV
jgi:hypothetical protein